MIKQLQLAQEKLRAIDKLTNCIQGEITSAQKNDIAYFIHEIVESTEWNSTIANKLLHWQIESKKSEFVTV